MTKRHKHAKKTASKSKATTQPKKSLKKTPKGGRPKHPANPKRKRPQPIQRSKVVAKGAKIYKRRTPKQLRGNKGTGKPTKRSRNITPVTKGRKGVSKTYLKSPAKIRRRPEPEITETKKLKTSKNPRHDKEGKRIKEKVLPGYRQYFRVDLPKGDFDKTVDAIRNGDFTFLNEGLTRNRPLKGKGPKEPRAVIITIETSYRGKKHYHRKISEPTFIVRKDNVKKLILQRLNEYQENWFERKEAEGDEDEQNYMDFAPKNISGIDIEFVY